MSEVTVAATQMTCSWDRGENIARAERLVRQAAAQGAQIILLQELFETPYFCKDLEPKHLALAVSIEENPAVKRMRALAAELQVVLPISVFERANNALFNTLAIIDADGALLGTYRKSHIPDGPGYLEKFYFSPGDTGFRVWPTRYGRLGAAVCWDQWFPEAARIMALNGADLLCYPTAIGSEPLDPAADTRDHWQRVMQGHAAANIVPIVASNRIGREIGASCTLNFYGSSFIADQFGAKCAEAGRDEEAVIIARFDFEMIRCYRIGWGVFRDRRPDLYGGLASLDGTRA
ncbi:MAG: N-carbamoylputrescine amidase [Alphaproteobacteria bacterium]|nr:N-carbamoylputrescine amidase [Alphaproteobacteria bacterium]